MSEFPPGSTRDRGQHAEQIAARHVERAGLSIVARNEHVAGGELDLIARGHDGDADLLVFIEVRSRASDRHGDPLETIDAKKRAHLIRAATSYLQKNHLLERVAVRFDVISIVLPPNADPQIQWLKAAFEAN